MITAAQDAIAVTGMAGRFPGAGDVAGFWANTVSAGQHITRNLRDDGTVGWARGELTGIDEFDHEFFGISGREAVTIDPQHRIFLECAWEALEDAGRLGRSRIPRTGVFASANHSGYRDALAAAVPHLAGMEAETGTDKDFLATRVAYKLDLRGIAVTVQTACSSSLVAIHLACRSLAEFEVDQALAGGVSVVLPGSAGWRYEPRGIHSPDGACRPFDAAANGTVMGDGAAVVVLRRLEDALADGDHVYAVILGSAVSNDGSRKLGYAAPSIDGQLEVIVAAHSRADISPGDISYVEAHGTGTPLGDHAELRSLAEAFRQHVRRPGHCWLSSSKGAVGHLDTAAGAAALMKASLALTHRVLPGTPGHAMPCPDLRDRTTPFTVSPVSVPWRGRAPRRAAVTCLGVGGTNAHAVLAEPPRPPAARRSQALYPLLVSAKNPAALSQARRELAGCLARPGTRLADAAYTLAVGREHFPCRTAVTARTRAQAASNLRGSTYRTLPASAEPPALVFGFPGQGTGLAGTGRALYRAEPEFARHFDECAQHVADLDGPDLVHAITAPAHPGPGVTATALAQPLMVAVQYALAGLLASCGIRPQACLGHSLGEITAALIAGHLDLGTALGLAVRRGAAMEDTPPGAMFATALTEAEVKATAPPGVTVAAVNSPAHTVVAGPRGLVTGFGESLAARGVRCELVQDRYAFHTPLMAGPAAQLAGIDPAPAAAPALPCLSGVTGTWMTTAPDGRHWQRHAVEPVRFAQCIATAASTLGDILVLDLGPGDVAARAASACRDPRVQAVACLRQRGARSEREALTIALARAWEQGISPAWDKVLDGAGRRVPLPTYPFQRRVCWPAAPGETASAADPAAAGLARLLTQPEAHPELRLATWREHPQPSRRHGEPGYGSIVVLTDATPGHDELASGLRAAFPGAMIVRAATDPATQVSPSGLTICPDSPQDLRRILDRSRPQSGLRLVVCAWALHDLPPPEAARRTYGTLLALAQAAEAAGPQAGPTDAVIVTCGAHDVLGTESGHPWLAAVTGLARVVNQEIGHLRARVTDLEPATPGDLGASLVAEASTWAAEPLVAVRGRRRWVPRYQLLPHPAADPDPGGPPGPVTDVVIGTGKIGSAAARVLAARGSHTIVIVAHEGSRGQSLDRELAALGARTENETVDAGDPASMHALIGRILSRHPAIGTLVHAAGVSGDRAYQPLAQASPWDRDPHLRVKAGGLAALASAVEGHTVGRVILMSSLAAVLGALNLGPYAAASAVMDAYASRARPGSAPWISIGWDAWHDDDTAVSHAEMRMTAGGLATDAAEAALARVLAAACPGQHVLVTRPGFEKRWDRFVRQPLQRASAPGDEPPAPGTGGEHDGLPLLVLQAWRRCLGDDSLQPGDDVFSHGADSLTGMEVLDAISAAIGLQLPARLLFDAPTPAALAARAGTLAAFGTQPGRTGPGPRVRAWSTTGPVIWLMHPASGDAEGYQPLAEALAGYRCRAVVGVPLADLRDSEDIPELARRYLQALAEDGLPAAICGWSYGAALGYEAAQQIRGSAGSAPGVVLIDLPAPGSGAGRSVASISDAELLAALGTHRARELQRTFTLTAASIRAACPDDAFRCVLEHLREQQLVPASFPETLARRLTTGYRNRITALERYRPAPYPGAVTLIRAAEPEFGDSGLMDGVLAGPPGDWAWGWAALAEGGCDVHVIGAHHATVLAAGTAAIIAGHVKAAAALAAAPGA
jgi:phthiocerol/phenolphthiocerol synthesis type-I polyketide synthase E